MSCFICNSEFPDVFFKDSAIDDPIEDVEFEACESCLNKSGWDINDHQSLFSLFKVYSTDKLKSSTSMDDMDDNNTCENNHKCNQCGSDLFSVIASGIVGCEKCYKSYKMFIKDIINSNRFNDNDKNIEKAMKILNEAIESEDYESAARIRDIISSMEKN